MSSNNEGRRSSIKRRIYIYNECFPERRSNDDRRNGIDRRNKQR